MVSRVKGTRLMCGYLSIFGLLSSLGHVTWAGAGSCNEGRAAGKIRHNGNIEVRGGTIVIENNVHARSILNLTIHHTSEGWDRLCDVHLGAIV